MIEVFTNPANLPYLAHRPALANLPPSDWPHRLREALLSVRARLASAAAMALSSQARVAHQA